MNKAIFVIIIAVVTTLISTLLQFFMRGGEVSPAIRRPLWILFTAGVVALIITFILIVTR